ncbi:MAG TPA: IPT/TIG domain-containing protein, partial [Candidatus Limnocylindria bacterium]|nr:IPT/TIG domain-containing protein [Candidatus Limnocylindria bacterium]
CAAGSSDAFVTRFDLGGKELWTRQFGGMGYDDVAGIAVDAGNIFVAGSQFAGSVQYPARAVDHAFLARLEKAAAADSPSETRILHECVGNAASGVGGAVSPGEIVKILGAAIGPSTAVAARTVEGLPFDTTLGETRVLFGGVAAPLLEVSSGQVTAIVPNAVAGRTSVEVQVEYRGTRSNAVTLPVLQAHPGIFGLDSSGWGAVRNEDGSVNSPENPARRGSTVSIYGTGGGTTDRATADGQVVGSSPARLKTTVLVYFPETEDTVSYVPVTEASYAGAVPGLVAGVLQVNIRVPESLPDGNWRLDLGFGGWSEAQTQSLQIAVSGK